MVAVLATGASVEAGEPGFSLTDVTLAAGFDYEHRDLQPAELSQFMGGGVAAGDYDGDGWTDLYVVSGSAGRNMLWRNLGDGTFVELAASAGLGLTSTAGSGPTFVDLDGDGWLDLVIGNLRLGRPWLFRNRGDGTFDDETHLRLPGATSRAFSVAAGDFDRDGDFDLFFSQWNEEPADVLWRNDGDFRFSSATVAALGDANQHLLWTFTPNFADLNGDAWLDLVVTGDFDNSQVLLSNGDGTLRLATDESVIVDQNGMGGALGDYDNDGDLDWFVSSIYDAEDPFYQLGNRLYRNLGDGRFEDVTQSTKVHHGHWGWGSCWADFDNDGRLDIFHVNGWRDAHYIDDPSRLFMQGSAVAFDEQAVASGLDDRGQGRGIVCFDYDHDNDLDLFVANNSGPPKLYRNDGGNALGSLLTVQLRGPEGNHQGIGARLWLTAGGEEQMREMQAGSNYVSQNPALAYFGLGSATTATLLRIQWPDGRWSITADVAADQRLAVDAGTIFTAGFESGDLSAWSGFVSGTP